MMSARYLLAFFRHASLSRSGSVMFRFVKGLVFLLWIASGCNTWADPDATSKRVKSLMRSPESLEVAARQAAAAIKTRESNVPCFQICHILKKAARELNNPDIMASPLMDARSLSNQYNAILVKFFPKGLPKGVLPDKQSFDSMAMSAALALKNITVENIILAPVSKADADQWMRDISKFNAEEPEDRKALFELKKRYLESFSKYAKPVCNSVNLDKRVRMQRWFDDDIYDFSLCEEHEEVMAPCKATQIHLVDDEYGQKKRLVANRIIYDGSQAGIAIPGPSVSEVDDLLKMAFQEEAGVFVDLISDSDRNETNRGASRFDWGSIGMGQPGSFGNSGITVREDSAETIDFGLQVESEIMGRVDAKAIVRIFTLQHPDRNAREIRQVSFPDWPDGEVIPLEVLEKLQQVVDSAEDASPGALIVNCMAGVGRTGTFFATRHLRMKAKKRMLVEDNLNAQILSTILHGKLSRNWEFVQWPAQAHLVACAARRYLKQQENTTADLPQNQQSAEKTNDIEVKQDAQPVQIADFSMYPATIETGRSFYTHFKACCLEGGERPLTTNVARLKYNDLVNNHLISQLGANAGSGIPRVPGLVSNPSDLYATAGENSVKPRKDLCTPLAHTQVVTNKGNEQEKRLVANHIYLSNGKYAGIAMQGPRFTELDDVLLAAFENNIHVYVDLANENEHSPFGTYADGENDLLDWEYVGNQIPQFNTQSSSSSECSGVGIYTPSLLSGYLSCSRQSLPSCPELQFDIQLRDCTEANVVSSDGNYSGPVVIRHFVFSRKGNVSGKQHYLSYIWFKRWPDGEAVNHRLLKSLIRTVEDEAQGFTQQDVEGSRLPVMVSCVAGLGRTGQYFAAKDIKESFRVEGLPDLNKVGMRTLNAIVAVRACRSGDAIQTPAQVYELIKMERHAMKQAIGRVKEKTP